MPKVKLYNVEGKVVGEKELSPAVFGVAVNPQVVHEVMVGLMANARQPLAHTKTKGEVRGGGKKPWKQKGTGRARQGSTRNPQWVGGGVAFGPRAERDYTKKINAKLKKKALLMALSDKVTNERLVLVEALAAKEGKTKQIVGELAKLPVKGKVTLVNGAKDEMLARSVKNLRTVKLFGTGNISLTDVLRADYLVLDPGAVEKFEKTYAAKKA
jgi:large subunit ribosomal protein L4